MGHGLAAPPLPVPSIWDLDVLFCSLGGGTQIPSGFSSLKRLTGVPPANHLPLETAAAAAGAAGPWRCRQHLPSSLPASGDSAPLSSSVCSADRWCCAELSCAALQRLLPAGAGGGSTRSGCVRAGAAG